MNHSFEELYQKNATLYDRDYFLWLVETLQVLKKGELSKLDQKHLIQEIYTLGRREQRELFQAIKQLLFYLLRYQFCYSSHHCQYKITVYRQTIFQYLQSSPSLQVYLKENFEKAYQEARVLFLSQGELMIQPLSSYSPFTLQQCLKFDFFPEVNQEADVFLKFFEQFLN